MLDLADRYAAIGKSVGLSPVEMAIAWVLSRPYTATALSSCTNLKQLDALIKVADVTLAPETLAAIDAAHAETRPQFH